MRIIVTRPAPQAEGWVQRLADAGFDAAALPLLGIGPAPDPAAVREAWGRLGSHAFVFFASGAAVDGFFAERPQGAPWPAGTDAGAPGPGTAAGLRSAGVPAAQVIEPDRDAGAADSEALWRRLESRDWRGRQVLVVRGEDGRDWLADRWREAGARVDWLAAYRRTAPGWTAEGEALMTAARARPQAHLWLLTSSQAVAQLAALPGGAPKGAPALATHARIAEAARAAGLDVRAVCGPTPEAVIEALGRLAGAAGGPPA